MYQALSTVNKNPQQPSYNQYNSNNVKYASHNCPFVVKKKICCHSIVKTFGWYEVRYQVECAFFSTVW